MPYLKKATDAPFGLTPYTAPLRLNEYTKGSAVCIFKGDIVEMLATGLVTRLADIAGGVRLIVGVAAQTVTTASAATTIAVYDHPDQLYACQEDSVGTAIAQTHVGNLFAPTGLSPAATEEAAGISITELDTSTTSATVGVGQNMLQLIGLHPIEGGSFPSAAGNPRKVIVKILAGTHLFATQSGAI